MQTFVTLTINLLLKKNFNFYRVSMCFETWGLKGDDD